MEEENRSWLCIIRDGIRDSFRCVFTCAQSDLMFVDRWGEWVIERGW